MGSEGNEKTSIYRGVRCTEFRFIDVIPFLFRYVKVCNNVRDYLFSTNRGKI